MIKRFEVVRFIGVSHLFKLRYRCSLPVAMFNDGVVRLAVDNVAVSVPTCSVWAFPTFMVQNNALEIST